MARIVSPNKSFNGIRFGVAFSNGEGHTTDKRAMQWFKDRGYKVLKDKPESDGASKSKTGKATVTDTTE